MKNSEQIFRDILYNLKTTGKKVSPRNKEVIEIEDFCFDLSPYVRFCSFEARRLSLSYIKQEFIWYLNADRFDASITQHASLWKDLINDDGSINSNYGQYMFDKCSGFNYALCTLIKDKDSRRASIMILNRCHVISNTKDLPCTFAISFRIRDNKLNMSVHMRSQDAIYGMGNDIPTFSFLHEMLYIILKTFYRDLEYGNYHHCVDSFHVYKKHYNMLDEIINGSHYINIECPKISCVNEVHLLLTNNFDNGYDFSNWLINKEKT